MPHGCSRREGETDWRRWVGRGRGRGRSAHRPPPPADIGIPAADRSERELTITVGGPSVIGPGSRPARTSSSPPDRTACPDSVLGQPAQTACPDSLPRQPAQTACTDSLSVSGSRIRQAAETGNIRMTAKIRTVTWPI